MNIIIIRGVNIRINPSSTKYMYFVADVSTGNVYFAESYEEHKHNVETYINSKLKDK